MFPLWGVLCLCQGGRSSVIFIMPPLNGEYQFIGILRVEINAVWLYFSDLSILRKKVVYL